MLTLAEIAKKLDGELSGDASLEVTHLATIQSASADALTFLANPRYRGYLENTRAGAVLCTAAEAEHSPVATIVVKDPYLAFAKIGHEFDPRPEQPAGVHPSAVIADDVKLPASVHIGAQVVIEAGVQLGEGCVIMAGCYVGADCRLGQQVRLWPHVTLYHQVTIGDRSVIHANSVVGADGFGFAFTGAGWTPVAQVGGVIIGNDVNIGASTTIDRGAVEATQIGNGVIIDNQVQVAHNVVIGEHTAIAGSSGISGSVRIGRFCLIGGACGIAGHLEICDKVQISGMSRVTGNITEPGAYASGTTLDKVTDWRKSAVHFRHLNDIHRRLKRLEKQSN